MSPPLCIVPYSIHRTTRQNNYMLYTTDGAGSYKTGTLHSGYDGDATVCLVDDCYVSGVKC